MISPEAGEVTARFYQAIDRLIEQNVIPGRQTFCRRYDIDKRYFYLIEKSPLDHALKVAWLTYIVRDYGVSAHWLLTGRGKMTRKTTVTKRPPSKRSADAILE